MPSSRSAASMAAATASGRERSNWSGNAACSISNANSYARLTPSSWVGIIPCMGTRNREVAIRLCPRAQDSSGVNPRASIEYRLADATANPYLVLAAIINAGMDGMRAELAAPPDIQVDPATLTSDDIKKLNLVPLPSDPAQTLAQAKRLEHWFGLEFDEAFRAVRENDIADAERLGNTYIDTLMLAI